MNVEFPNIKGFKMGMLNIVSLPKYIDEIRIILADQYFDVLALNETRLDKNISNQDMFVQNYDLIRADRSRSGGGVCLYVKNSINYLNRNELVGDSLEAICIEVLKPSSASFIVGTIYRPIFIEVGNMENAFFKSSRQTCTYQNQKRKK